MSTLTIELPDRLATELAKSKAPREQLSSFLVGAVETWLKWRGGAFEPPAATWARAFEEGSTDFVDQLIDDNKALFEELARR